MLVNVLANRTSACECGGLLFVRSDPAQKSVWWESCVVYFPILGFLYADAVQVALALRLRCSRSAAAYNVVGWFVSCSRSCLEAGWISKARIGEIEFR